MSGPAALPDIQSKGGGPPAGETLVRMDIAVFVGFAASGPLNRPVAVESIPQFEEIFGSDLALAVDGSGQTVYACLPSSVRAFYRNGGGPGLGVGVAGPGATPNTFSVV